MTTKHLILLHGALGSSAQFDELSALLENDFTIHRFNFSGHGGKAEAQEFFRIERFSEELRAYVNEHNLEKPFVFGYSMGGYVAMQAELGSPGLLGSLLTLGSKWEWNPTIAEAEVKKLNPNLIEQKVPQFARLLEERHAPLDWKVVVERTAEMMQFLGRNPLNETLLNRLQIPVYILLGERDNMVTRDESERIASKIPNGHFSLLSGTPHPIEQVDAHVLVRFLRSL